jgi:hypothetical protein
LLLAGARLLVRPKHNLGRAKSHDRQAIDDTARRAISLEQLERIIRHVSTRLGCSVTIGEYKSIKVKWQQVGERWLGSRMQEGQFSLTRISFSDVNLYDLNKYVISPSTAARQCSIVELMAKDDQPPDYFVSHFWGDRILDFFQCLLKHAQTRNLEQSEGWVEGRRVDPHPLYLGGRSPQYWVCAFGNNQHDLVSEIVDDLQQTSFARAMRLARGTVSILDSAAACFGRICSQIGLQLPSLRT